MVFKKEKMLARIKAEGREEMVDGTVLAILENLDGQTANASNWRRQVYGEPVLWVVGKNGEGEYVNEKDCE